MRRKFVLWLDRIVKRIAIDRRLRSKRVLYRSLEGQDQRLSLFLEQMGDGFEFHSLVLEARHQDHWAALRAITWDAVGGEVVSGRFVSDLCSFDAANATAIVKLGEASFSRNRKSREIAYSLRKLDVAKMELNE